VFCSDFKDKKSIRQMTDAPTYYFNSARRRYVE